MTRILDWGMAVVLWFQQFSPTLDIPFIGLSFLGDEKLFLPLLPILFWCVHRRIGAEVGFLLLFSAYVNALVKHVCAQPRPTDYDERVKPISPAHGEGFPSGHTQTTFIFWGYLATELRQRWTWVAAIFFMIFIPISRVYVGAHFPTDLLGGYILGMIMLLLYRGLSPIIVPWLAKQQVLTQIFIAVVAAIVLILIAGSDKNSVTGAAMLMGVSCGIAMERRWVGFDACGPVWQRVLRFLVGAMSLGMLFGLLHLIFDAVETALVPRIIRYGLLGWWVSCGAPILFLKLGLAHSEH